jgi:1-acyl-sn-glycerol-3-phosphate acyltransferase
VRTPHPPKSFWVAHIVRVTLGAFLVALFRVSLPGSERIPKGGVILAGNHLSYGDPVLLWCRSPRPVHFMARSDLWDSGFIGWCLDHFWAFPVRRAAADREALAQASAYLQAGEPVGIFPEGTRKFKNADEETHGGAAFLAIRNNVPVVPIGIAGTDHIKPPGSRLLHFPRVVMCVGEPIDPAEFAEGGRKERVDAMTARIMQRIAEQAAAAEEARAR